MKRNGPAMTTHIDKWTQFLSFIISQLPRDIDPQLLEYYLKDPVEISEKLREIFKYKETKSKSVLESYPIVVDYHAVIEPLLEWGNYDWISPLINSANFPSTREGIVSTTFHLFSPTKELETKHILTEFDKEGLRAAELRELLAFRTQHRKVAQALPIAALGSLLKDRTLKINSPFSVFIGDEHYLGLESISGLWHPMWCFGGVPKTIHTESARATAA